MENETLSAHLIAFLGPVGGGKSTQRELLISKLRKKGCRVESLFLKTNHSLAYLLSDILRTIFGYKRASISPVRDLLEESPKVYRRLFPLWLVLDLVSLSLRFLMRVYLPIKLGYVVVVEEYIPAVLSDYVYICRKLNIPIKSCSPALRFLLKLMSVMGSLTSTRIIFLDSSPANLERRWEKEKKVNEKSEYVSMQKTLLLRLSKHLPYCEAIYLRTDKQSIRQTHREIMKFCSLIKNQSKE